MKDLNQSEKDMILRGKLYSELSRHNIKDTTDRIVLKYTEAFKDITSSCERQISLCEDCFISIYDHKSKRTYESWKCMIKKSIVFDKAAADIQNRLPPKRKQKNR